jgi:hypothetical protein
VVLDARAALVPAAMDIEADVWADGEQDALAEIAALSGAPAPPPPPPPSARLPACLAVRIPRRL